MPCVYFWILRINISVVICLIQCANVWGFFLSSIGVFHQNVKSDIILFKSFLTYIVFVHSAKGELRHNIKYLESL